MLLSILRKICLPKDGVDPKPGVRGSLYVYPSGSNL